MICHTAAKTVINLIFGKKRFIFWLGAYSVVSLHISSVFVDCLLTQFYYSVNQHTDYHKSCPSTRTMFFLFLTAKIHLVHKT